MKFRHLQPDPTTLWVPMNDKNRIPKKRWLDKHVEKFIRRRLITKYTVARRQEGYLYEHELEQEIIAFATKYNLELPSGCFVKNIVTRVNREQDSEKL